MLGELLALMVLTIVRVFPQMCMDCLEKRCVLMIEGYLFEYLLVLLEVIGTLLVGTDVGLLIRNFGKFWGNYLFKRKFCVFYSILG